MEFCQKQEKELVKDWRPSQMVDMEDRGQFPTTSHLYLEHDDCDVEYCCWPPCVSCPGSAPPLCCLAPAAGQLESSLGNSWDISKFLNSFVPNPRCWKTAQRKHQLYSKVLSYYSQTKSKTTDHASYQEGNWLKCMENYLSSAKPAQCSPDSEKYELPNSSTCPNLSVLASD